MSFAPFNLRLTALAALALTTTATHAAIFVTENIAGTLSETTLFGGVALGSVTEFSFSAVFNADPASNQSTDPGVGIYPVTSLSVTVAGKGTYDTALDSSLFAVIADPSNGELPYNIAGLSDDHGDIVFSVFNSATPGLDARAPGAVVLNDYLGTMYGAQLIINLTGVTGGLVLSSGSFAGPVTATLTVPEPATCALVAGGGLLAFAGGRRRR